MRYRRLNIVLILALITVSVTPQEIRISLYHGKEIQAMVFSTLEGEYLLSANNKQIAVVRKGSMFHIERKGSGLAVHDTNQSYGIFTSLQFTGVASNNVFQIKPVLPSLPAKESDNDLSVSIFNESLRIINRLNLEQYLPGTVEAEGGSSALPEYYKAQAVIARTFAVKNFHRHAHEGFNLCDGTHCQAYNGKSRLNEAIYAATLSTRDEILVDRAGEPVIAAYHANCGGLTGRASVEWNRELPYLSPVKDPFCNNSAHRNWTKTITLREWNDYLERKGYDGKGNLFLNTINERYKYLDQENKKLPLTEIRNDLKLKSSYFHVSTENGSVMIIGHGYGHGLGLCQEGAMEMARVGYSYVDILMFYFSRVKIATRTVSAQPGDAP